MKTLIATLALLVALPASAGHRPEPGHRPPAWGPSPLLAEARDLDRSTTQLYHAIRSHSGRTETAQRAGRLADAARNFRALAERRAPEHVLREAYRDLRHRYARLDLRFDHRGREYRLRQAAGLVEQVQRDLDQLGRALQGGHWAKIPNRGRNWPRYQEDSRWRRH